MFSLACILEISRSPACPWGGDGCSNIIGYLEGTERHFADGHTHAERQTHIDRHSHTNRESDRLAKQSGGAVYEQNQSPHPMQIRQSDR